MTTERGDDGLPPLKKALLAVQRMKARVQQIERAPVAIVGAGCRFPGGVVDLDSYWELLASGRDAIREVPAGRWDVDAWFDADPDAPGKMRVREAGFLDDVATFDASFFGISPREAIEMDPAQRLLLLTAWEALEAAGIAPQRLDRTATGVYIGLGLSDYGRRHFLGPDPRRMTAYSGTGTFLSVAAGRISYSLGLEGPALTVDTACSSSLVSVHLAVNALRRREIDVALAGGANLLLTPEPSVYFSKLDAMAQDGRCKTFDASADGYARGEGAAVLALKRLDDALADGDPIVAVIRGTAVNQDGRSNGLTAPSGRAQQAVIRAALRNAGVEPEQVGMVEAHGTGTPLGDPIEVDALRAVYGATRESGRPLRLGSVKTNFGHTETAAGVAGLLKLAMAARRGEIPAHLHLQQLNPRIQLDGTPIEIPTETVPWTDDERIGGVSSFGLSGTNAHVVLSGPPRREPAPSAVAGSAEVITLSARSVEALRDQASRVALALQGDGVDGTLGDVAFSAHSGRSALPQRLVVSASDTADAAARLTAFAAGDEPALTVFGKAPSLAPSVVFLFTGQGSQRHGMGQGLYDSDVVFRGALDAVFAVVDPLLERPLRDVMWGDDDALHDTRYTQPALYALEVALARWMMHHGAEPDALVGHSIGELAAAHIAGVFSLADGAKLVVERGRLMSELPRDGSMAAIFAPESDVLPVVEAQSGVGIAGVNNPTETVISGPTAGVDATVAHFEGAGVRCRALTVSHAFHSGLMEPMLDAFEAVVRSVTLSPPTIEVISNLDGQPAGDRLCDPQYWRDHVRNGVRFADGVQTLREAGHRVFVECGPRPVLSGMGARCFGDEAATWLATLHPDQPDPEQIHSALGGLWCAGATDLSARYPAGRRVKLPTMAWQGESYWLDRPDAQARDPYGDLALELVFRAAPAPVTEVQGTWGVLGDGPRAEALGAAVRERSGAVVTSDDEVGEATEAVLWVAPSLPAGADVQAWTTEQVVALQGLVRELSEGSARLYGVTEGAHAPEDATAVAAAALQGAMRVVALEHPELFGGTVDVTGAFDAEGVVASCAAADEDRVWIRDGKRRVARLVQSRAAVAAGTLEVQPDGAVWITGGFGSLGRSLARWFADRGAGHLVLTGRSGASTDAAQELVAELEGRGVQVTAAAVDVADAGQVAALLADVGPMQGVVHAAGTNDDGRLLELTEARIADVLKAKVAGGWALHEATADQPLSFFVLMSSAAAWLGVPGQANYAAGNAFLDALARHRRAAGQPATSLAYGPWADSAMVDALGADIEALWAHEGVHPLSTAEALAVFERAAASEVADVLVAPFAWPTYAATRPRPSTLYRELVPETVASVVEAAPEVVGALRAAPAGARRRMLSDHVSQVASRVLGFDAGRRLDPSEGFFDAGLDSLMAVDLRNRLQASLGTALSATIAFDHPTIDRVTTHLLDDVLDLGEAAPVVAAAAQTVRSNEPIAIVGAGCRLPGHTGDLGSYWELLLGGVDGITEVPGERYDVDRYFDPTPATPGRLYSRWGGFVDDITEFDPVHFGISPREAESLDPQQRMLLECSWQALEDAGVPPLSLQDAPVGVFVGIGQSEYWQRFDATDASGAIDAYAGTGNETSFAAGRVAYVLGVQGPTMSINTACSSSLVSVHQAVAALREGTCTVALAGGVNAIVGPETTIWMSMLQALAPDGRCKPFDHRANGYVRSEGCGMIVLKRLSDAQRDGDRIYAVVRGSAVNHDGASSGLTVPNGVAQQRVLASAYADAGVLPSDVGYVECHGTGTKLGDPIEVRAIGNVLAAERDAGDPVYLGSVKANIGHLEAGAGIAGLLKAMLVLEHATVPPHLHLERPNPELPLDTFPAIRMATDPVPLRSRFAGVSSFGISGTNAHVVLEAAPERPRTDVSTDRPVHLLTLSGRTEAGLAEHAAKVHAHVQANPRLRLADLAFTLNAGRSHLRYRGGLVAHDLAEATDGLQAASEGRWPVQGTASGRPRLVFLCTGAGPQMVGMARELYDASATFRDALDAAIACADPHLDQALFDVIYPAAGGEDASPLGELAYTQPAMFAIEWAMAALWRSWGVEPDAVIGHSTGQYVAACLAGVFDLPTGMKLMCTRARMMSDQPRIGSMVAVMATEDVVRGYLAGDEAEVDIAAVNGPEEAVISGLNEPVNAIADRIEADGIEIRRLRISHAAHSPLMEPILDDFEAVVAGVQLHPPVLPLIENVRGEVADARILEPRYWRDHMRHGVSFHAGMRTLADLGYRHFLEIGNHPILSGAGARSLEDHEDTLFVPSIRRKHPEWPQLLESAARLHAAGVPVDFEGLHAEQPGQRIALPTVPFQRKRYWVERPERSGSARIVGDGWVYGTRWEPVRPNVDAFGGRGAEPLLIIGDPAGLGTQLAKRQQRGCVVVTQGSALAVDADAGTGTVDLDDADQMRALFEQLQPKAVVHLGALALPQLEAVTGSMSDAAAPAVRSALHMLQACSRVGNPPVTVVTRGATSVTGEAPEPVQAPLLGLLNVAAVELADQPCMRLDLDPHAPDDDLFHIELVLNHGAGEDQWTIHDGQPHARRLEAVPADQGPQPEISSEGTYWITGGLGALGLRVARWLSDSGAGAIVLTSRSAPSEDAEQAIARLDGREGQSCVVMRGDISVRADVDRIVADIGGGDLPPLRGVFHAAGGIDDASLLSLDWERFPSVWAPKLDGSWNLHWATRDLSLDLFVGFSSAAGFIGSAGQGNYGAANGFLDALMSWRRAEGLPGVSHAWGPWGEIGLAVTDTQRAWARGGVTPLVPAQGIAVMSQLLAGQAEVAIVDLDWTDWPLSLPRVPSLVAQLVQRPVESEGRDAAMRAELQQMPAAARPQRLLDLLAVEVGGILRLDPDEIDPDQGFFDAGMDSLMAVELVNRLKPKLGVSLPATLAFDQPNLNDLRDHILQALTFDSATPAPLVALAAAGERHVDLDTPVAIVGIGCRMPGGANDPEAFWELLRSGRDPMIEVPPTRWDLSAYFDPVPGTPGKMYVREAGFVDQDVVEGFDPEFFGISGREAASMDPQQRMLLEVAYEALEQAGLATPALRESRTGVFIGAGDSGYLQRFQDAGDLLYDDVYAGTGNLSAFVSGRLSYVLGLNGPNLTLNTACSSSLVALHLACQSLRTGDAEVAIAGGVHLMLSPENFIYVSQIKALSSDGRCKTFDSRANGYGRAEGCGVVVCKRLDAALRDGDPVLAVVRGTALNHDGPSSGLTVPYGPAQVQVLSDAVARSGIDPLDVSYIEAHGTGTVLGDPIEVHAIESVYCQGRTEAQPLHLGAVKANVGHMEVAAGAASVVKMVLALQHRQLPPQLHYDAPNPDLAIGGRLQVTTEPRPWDVAHRVCGVSAFGLAGTNVHVVMEQAPEPQAPPSAAADAVERPAHVLAITARSPEALRALASRYGERLLQPSASLADVAYTAHHHRDRFEHRLAVVGSDAGQAAGRLAAWVASGDAPAVVEGVAMARSPRVAFLFSGQGSQYPGMGRELYDTQPVFRAVVDRCASILEGVLSEPLLEVMFAAADDDRIHDTAYTQPCLFTLEVALAELWRSWGVEPAIVAGHSIGQLSAACVAGACTVEQGLLLVAERGRLMSALPRDGAMYAAFAEGDVVDAAMEPHRGDVGVAARNNPGETVISGKTEAVHAVAAALEAQGIEGRHLTVSHAFHSPLMEPMLHEFEEAARNVEWSAPGVPVLCNQSGGVAPSESLTEPRYWRDLVRAGVRFADNLQTLHEAGHDVFVEIGPHSSLLGMGRRTLTDRSIAWLPSLRRGHPDTEQILPSAGALYTRGVPVDWRAFDAQYTRVRLHDLPSYPWQRRRTWIDKPEFPQQVDPAAEWLVEETWSSVQGAPQATVSGRWVVLGDSLLAGALRDEIASAGATCEMVTDLSDAGIEVALGGELTHVVHVDAVHHPGADPTDGGAQSATWTLLRAAQCLAARAAVTLSVVTRGSQGAGDAAVSHPGQGALWGLARVLRMELGGLSVRSIDLADDAAVGDAARLLGELRADDGEPEVALRGEQRLARRLMPGRFGGSGAAVTDDGAYLVTGGLGGLGLEVARWLAAQGARHLVLTGRSAPKPHAEAVLDALRADGVQVVVARGDVGVADDVAKIIAQVPDEAPLRGVVHAAGVLRDAAVANQDVEALATVFHPKVGGTWQLHQATESLQLDFFVLFSGGASLMGSPGQANYSAANAYLDSFAGWRRSQGLPCVAIQWGAWAEVGMAAALGEGHRARQAREGIHPIPLAAGMDVLGRLLTHTTPAVGVLPVDWDTFVGAFHGGRAPALLAGLAQASSTTAVQAPVAPPGSDSAGPAAVTDSDGPPLIAALRGVDEVQWPETIDAFLHAAALRVLQLDANRELDRDRPLIEMGLDSLLAVDLRNDILDGGVEVPVARVMTGPPLRELTQVVQVHLADVDLGASGATAAASDAVAPVAHTGSGPHVVIAKGPFGLDPIASHLAVFALGVVAAVGLYVGTLVVAGPKDGVPIDSNPVENAAPEPAKGKAKAKAKRGQ